jgi:hypothetical protein
MVATVGVHLKPLVDEIPGFGALVVTLTKPPKVKYNIDTGGAVVGKVLGGGVEAFLDNLLPDILNGFLVWPQRIVVPILPENVTGPLTDLALRNQGILRVLSSSALPSRSSIILFFSRSRRFFVSTWLFAAQSTNACTKNLQPWGGLSREICLLVVGGSLCMQLVKMFACSVLVAACAVHFTW